MPYFQARLHQRSITPEPTATFTLVPTVTSEPTRTPPPTRTVPPTNTLAPTVPPKPENPIIVYYFNLKEAGRWGCGEAMYWVNTTKERGDSLENDIIYALQRLFSYHGEYFGTLYNPYGPSTFAIGGVDTTDDRAVIVNLTGTYVPTKDPCDGTRTRDQIKQTILQFPQINKVYIFINGSPIGDALSRKK